MKLKNLAWLLTGLLMVGCSSDDDNATESGNTVDGTSVESVLGLTEEQQTMVAPLNDFSVRLFQQQSSAKGNHSTVIAPLSTAFVLGMVNEGAEGQTSNEIAAALGMKGKDKATVSQLFAQYIKAIPSADNDVTVAMANNVSVNKLFSLRDSYQTAMEKDYGASVFSLDFTTSEATTAVNNWCSQYTRGLIPTITDRLDPNDVLCLLNAIYFKARWADAFDKSESRGLMFTNGNSPQVLTAMTKTATMQYGEQRGMQALRLPLAHGRYAMTFVLSSAYLPLSAFVRTLTAEQLGALSFSEQMVEAYIPVFTTTVDTDLIGLLKGMGITRLFSKGAELVNMVKGDGNLYVTTMKQNTRLGVDEDGCEGAAVTLAELQMGADIDGKAQEKKFFIANRPFVYYISEVQSGTILFMGQFCGDIN